MTTRTRTKLENIAKRAQRQTEKARFTLAYWQAKLRQCEEKEAKLAKETTR